MQIIYNSLIAHMSCWIVRTTYFKLFTLNFGLLNKAMRHIIEMEQGDVSEILS